jgi:succinate dehydrogenase / fumarate reductase, membrane anchor subunit
MWLPSRPYRREKNMAYPVSNNSGAGNWLFQRISGILILVILLIHLGAVHFGLNIVDLGTPVWKVFHLLFVILLLYHILNGFWILIEDYVQTRWLRLSLFGVTWIVGVVFLILGVVTLVPFGA